MTWAGAGLNCWSHELLCMGRAGMQYLCCHRSVWDERADDEPHVGICASASLPCHAACCARCKCCALRAARLHASGVPLGGEERAHVLQSLQEALVWPTWAAQPLPGAEGVAVDW